MSQTHCAAVYKQAATQLPALLDVPKPKPKTLSNAAGSNTVSVAEDEAMRILILMRNFLPAHEQSKNGEVSRQQLS